MGQERREFELRDYAAILSRRRWWVVLTFVAVMFGAAAFTYSQEPLYEASAQLLLSTKRAVPVVGEGSETLREPEDLPTQLELLRGGWLYDKARDQLKPPYQPVRRATTRINQYRDTNVVSIAVRHHNPEVAAAMAGAMADAYVQLSQDQNQEVTQQGLDFVRRQIKVVRGELDGAEQDLRAFKERTQLMDAPDSVGKVAGRADSLQQTVQNLQAERAGVGAELARVTQQLAATEDTIVSERQMENNPVVDTLRARLLELQMRRLEAGNTYAEGSRELRQLDDQIAALSRQLDVEAKRVLAVETVAVNPEVAELTRQQNALASRLVALDAQKRRVSGSIPPAEARVRRLPAEEVEYNGLIRRVKVTEDGYVTLLAREQELLIAKELQVADAVRIPGVPLPEKPVLPNPRQNLIVAAVLGLLMGIVLAIVVDYVDDSVKDPEEAVRLLEMPLLGVVGYTEQAGSQTVSEEAYRTLRSNIRFSEADREIRIVAVTSAAPGEGKSTVASNLAMAAANAGQTVILADMDLRKPSLHGRLELEADEGLTNVLVGEKTLADVLVPTGVQRMSLLPIGATPPNPVELLESQRIRELFDELRQRADFVVCDTSPLLPVVDAQIVSNLADGVVLVFETNVTSRELLRRAKQALALSGAHVLGLVANKVRGLERGYQYYRYRGNE